LFEERESMISDRILAVIPDSIFALYYKNKYSGWQLIGYYKTKGAATKRQTLENTRRRINEMQIVEYKSKYERASDIHYKAHCEGFDLDGNLL
jgi:hypothetical protein